MRKEHEHFGHNQIQEPLAELLDTAEHWRVPVLVISVERYPDGPIGNLNFTSGMTLEDIKALHQFLGNYITDKENKA